MLALLLLAGCGPSGPTEADMAGCAVAAAGLRYQPEKSPTALSTGLRSSESAEGPQKGPPELEA